MPADTSRSTNDPLALAQWAWRALLRHRLRAAAVFVAVVAIAIVGALLLPKEYESSARLLVKIGRESVTLDPTATVGQTLSVYDSRETEVNTIIEIAGSRAVLEDVVEELGPAVVLGESPAETSNGKPSRADVDRAVRALSETTAVERGRKSNVVDVTARAASPELAQRIVDAMLNAFNARYVVANRTAGSYDFFVEQERLVAADLDVATKDLNGVRNELEVASVEGERRRIETRLTELETARTTTATALAAANAKITSLEDAITSLPERRLTSEVTGFAEDAVGRTRQQLYALRLEEHDLLSRYAPSHPDVAAVRERIAEAQRVLDRADPRSTQTTTVANPAREQLELELLRERSNAAALGAHARELASLRDEARTRLHRLNGSEAKLVALSARVDRLRADHLEYAHALEQARIDRALAEDRISNVNVFQDPTYVPQAVGSQRRLIVFLGIALGLFSAVGTALGSEWLAGRLPRDEPTPADPIGSGLAASMAR